MITSREWPEEVMPWPPGTDFDEAKTYRPVGPICGSLTEAHDVAERVAITAKAFEIIARRGWDIRHDRYGWYVPIHLGWENCRKSYADCPAKAPIEAELWYKENVEKS